MLTPVDIQQKKFKVGLGYDKKDVNKFFEEVYESYAALYRSNAELKEKVINFNDRLQHYKTTEENLQKSLLLAEKNSEESKSNAEREAKAMELEARSRAEQIVKQASIDLKNMNLQMDELRDHYAEYKSKFAALLKEEFEFLGIKDFDTDMYIDPKYTERRKEQARRAAEAAEAEAAKSFNKHNSGPDISNSSKVYGSVLGGEGIDPFHSSNKESRYESSYTSSASKESSFGNKSYRQASQEKKHNKYSVNSDDEGAGPSFRGGFSEEEKINLFRNEKKKQEEAESKMKNDTASRINPDKFNNFTTDTSKATDTKAEQSQTKNNESGPKFSDFVKPGPKVQRDKTDTFAEEVKATEPHVEAPHVEEPHVEAPHVEEPHVEAPHVEEPKSEAIHTEDNVQETIEPSVDSVEERATVTNATQIETESSLGDSVEFETVFNEAVDKAKTNDDSLDDDDDFIFT